MRLVSLRIKGFKNLTGPDGWFGIDFTAHNGVTVLVGANGSGKSNVLEAISAIFNSFYRPKQRFECEYELEFSTRTESSGLTFPVTLPASFGTTQKHEVKIEQRLKNGKSKRNVFIDGRRQKRVKAAVSLLPVRVIAHYSGDDIRLQTMYKNYPGLFIRSGGQMLRSSPMAYIDRSYWSIALLTFIVSELSDLQRFASDLLGTELVSTITITERETTATAVDEQANALMHLLRGDNRPGTTYTLSIADFKQKILDAGYNERELVDYLARARSAKILRSVDITYGNGQTINDLSEGQKKLLLAKFILEVLADENSLVLLDEIDAHVHVGLKDTISTMLSSYPNRQVVLTTHSPTLMHGFNDGSVVYLTNGEVKGEEKRTIITEITAGNISYTEKEIILTSRKPLLLLVEGKTDVEHLKLAAEKLSIDINCDILACGNCDQISSFIKGMPSNLFDHNKCVIGVYDYDFEGLKAVRNLGREIEGNKLYSLNPSSGSPEHEANHVNSYGVTLPVPEASMVAYGYCPIEFLYPIQHLNRMAFIKKRDLRDFNKGQPAELVINLDQLNADQRLCTYTIDESRTSKVKFLESCGALEPAAFENFRPLFDKILELQRATVGSE